MLGWWLLIGPAAASTGCTQNWWNDFLNPSSTGNFRTNEIVEIQKSISFHDKPLGIPGATDPTPEDLVAYVEEYRIGPGDVLSIKLLDFLQVGYETDLTPVKVDELGTIHIQPLGLIQAEGRTELELQQDIIQRAKQAQIYREEDEPIVIVSVAQAMQRVFHVSGPANLVNSGMYAITRPDFRLREALNLAGGLDPLVKYVTVFRNQPREKRFRQRTMTPGVLPPAVPGTQPAPPVGPVAMSDTGSSASPATRTVPAGAPPATGSRLAVPREEAERELIEVLEPTTRTSPTPPPSAPATAPAGPATEPASAPTRPGWRFLNDTWVPTPQAGPPPQRPGPAPPPGVEPTPGEPVDWQELADEGQQRIIRIPADKLRNGEPSADIVIRNQDWIRLETGPIGNFYMGGQVERRGTYTFNGEEITLRQAIYSAGDLGPLAWPSRCSITRRIDENREEILQLDLARIMEGKDPDIYLKPNDTIVVGTHAIAPLLATIRNSFRLTYGFGFVYDRNFADIDAFFPQQNPMDRRRVALQQRFPGLLP